MSNNTVSVARNIPEFLRGGGELGEMIRSFDWSQTSLGPVSEWPKSLRTCVQIMLTSRQPYWIGWGKDLIKLYNDPYKAIAGGKHPWALGKPASVVWKDIWKDIEPMLKTVMVDNQGTYVESQLLIMERNGYPEETYYTFSYTPVAGDDGTTEGMICANSDDTERILSERHLRTLTNLGKAFIDVKSAADVYQRTVDSLSTNPFDLPYALIYELTEGKIVLVKSTPLGDAIARVPSSVSLYEDNEISSLVTRAIEERSPMIFEGIRKKLGAMPAGAWEVTPDKALILPIAQRGQKVPYGILVIGLNPFRLIDQKYQSFFELIADQIAISMADVHAVEEERKRLAALAEIDRAKTTFFSNISHEFRTPLTLLLGPIQDALHEPEDVQKNKERMDVALRNAQRMQKLVNLLLDFSRIEAGKMDPHFTPVDLVSLTEDLASNFRSAVEKAGMELKIIKHVPAAIASVDIDMWEKIILNLVSNALKYSEEGTIIVSVNVRGEEAEVSVTDTGLGIPESEIGKIFERFHRVQTQRGRSQEGTGIGLAMVKELVRLHKGSIGVNSVVGQGSTFTVSVPLSEVATTASAAVTVRSSGSVNAYLQEALQWSSNGAQHETLNAVSKTHTVLLADDNADMRRYIHRLLDADYHVIVVSDGEQAFAKAVEHKPDLILSDIMMPKLDGFGLLNKLKGNLSTRNIPVIFLSARAGEEARVEGIKAGANDYLTKPFSSKELLARVSNHIAISNTRRQTEKEFFNLFIQSPAHIHVMKGPDHVFEFFHPMGIAFTGRDGTGMKARDVIPEVEGQGFFEMLDRVYQRGETIHLKEAKVVIPDPKRGTKDHYFNITYLPWKDLHGNVQGVLQFTFEVTELVEARHKAEASEKNFKSIAEQAPVAICVLKGRKYVIELVNDPVLELWGRTSGDVVNKPLTEALPEITNQGIIELLNKVYDTAVPYKESERGVDIVRNGKLQKRYLNFIYEPFTSEQKETEGIIVVAVDVTDQVLSRKLVEEAEYKLQHAVELAELGTWSINLASGLVESSQRVADWWGVSTADVPLTEILDCVHADDRERVRVAIERAIKETGLYEAEYRLVNRKTRQMRFVHANGRVFFDDERKPVRLTGIVRDVTLVKMTQHELEHQVSIRTAELEELNNDLRRSNENLRQFAYVASHDLQEPLRKILTYSDLIRSKNKEHLDDRAKDYLEKIASGSHRMAALIRDLLEFSQAERKSELYTTVKLGEILNNIKQDYEVKIAEKNASIVIGELCSIRAIPLQMNQLFYNIIGNALKFSKPDVPPVIVVSSSTVNDDDKRRFNLDPSVEYCEITVEDNGIGFDPKFSEQIFVLFQRLHVRDKYEGTGIGLALCKKIVENHKGVIAAEAEVNKGSRFRIILPC